jgi:hypothetical protein
VYEDSHDAKKLREIAELIRKFEADKDDYNDRIISFI